MDHPSIRIGQCLSSAMATQAVLMGPGVELVAADVYNMFHSSLRSFPIVWRDLATRQTVVLCPCTL